MGKPTEVYVVFDLGGTNGRGEAYASLADRSSRVESVKFKMAKPSGSIHGADRAFRSDFYAIIDFVAGLAKEYTIGGISIAVAGELDEARSMVVKAGNLTHWVGNLIATILREMFGCPVVLGNDAEAAAMADAVYGVGAHGELAGRDMIGMIWGTGVGGAYVRFEGGVPHVTPGEPGHIEIGPVLADPIFTCGKGHTNCVETFAGGAAIKAIYGRPAELLRPNQLLDVAHTLTVGIKRYLNRHPAEVVVFSGGVANGQQWLLPYIEERLSYHACAPRVVMSHFGESAGTVGALAMLAAHLQTQEVGQSV